MLLELGVVPPVVDLFVLTEIVYFGIEVTTNGTNSSRHQWCCSIATFMFFVIFTCPAKLMRSTLVRPTSSAGPYSSCRFSAPSVRDHVAPPSSCRSGTMFPRSLPSLMPLLLEGSWSPLSRFLPSPTFFARCSSQFRPTPFSAKQLVTRNVPYLPCHTNSIIRCLQTGEWPQCVVTCPDTDLHPEEPGIGAHFDMHNDAP